MRLTHLSYAWPLLLEKGQEGRDIVYTIRNSGLN